MRALTRLTVAAAAVPLAAASSQSLTARQRAQIDSVVTAELKTSGAPSVSIAIVKDGAIAYAKAYGDARIAPKAKKPLDFDPGAKYQYSNTNYVILRQTGTSLRGGMTYRGYAATCGTKEYSISTFFMPDGRIEQYLITP